MITIIIHALINKVINNNNNNNGLLTAFTWVKWLYMLYKNKIGYNNKKKKMRITYNNIYMHISTKYLLQLLKFYDLFWKGVNVRTGFHCPSWNKRWYIARYEKEKTTLMVLADFSKAFDMVCFKTTLKKFYELRILRWSSICMYQTCKTTSIYPHLVLNTLMTHPLHSLCSKGIDVRFKRIPYQTWIMV